MSGETRMLERTLTPLACIVTRVFPVIFILLPFAARRTVLLSSWRIKFSLRATFSEMMVVVQPVSGVADTWKFVPASRASQRIRGGVPLLLRTALAYSGGESLGKSLLNSCSSVSSAIALFATSSGFPMPLQALVIWPGLLHFPQVTDCLLYTSPSPRDKRQSRMPSSA